MSIVQENIQVNRSVTIAEGTNLDDFIELPNGEQNIPQIHLAYGTGNNIRNFVFQPLSDYTDIFYCAIKACLKAGDTIGINYTKQKV
jgi:hypothetical protein